MLVTWVLAGAILQADSPALQNHHGGESISFRPSGLAWGYCKWINAVFVQYAVQSQVRWHGYDPETAIIFAEAQKVRVGCYRGMYYIV